MSLIANTDENNIYRITKDRIFILIIIPCIYLILNNLHISKVDNDFSSFIFFVSIILVIAFGTIIQKGGNIKIHPLGIISLISILVMFSYFCGIKQGEMNEKWYNMSPQEKKEYKEYIESIDD